MLLVTAALLVFASLSFADDYAVLLFISNNPGYGPMFILNTTCPGQTPIPDGQMIDIWWDADNNGPTPNDIQPPVGNPEDGGTVTFNQFPMNGLVDLDQEGTFYTADPLVTNGNVPLPGLNRFYLIVNTATAKWTSEPFTASRTSATPQMWEALVWGCEPIQSCVPDTFVVLTPTNLPFPNVQHVANCVTLCRNYTSVICVGPIEDLTNVPHLFVRPGCLPINTWCDDTCHAAAGWIVAPWLFTNIGGFNYYCTSIVLLPDGVEGCVCVEVDFIEPVNFESFGAVSGDNSVTVNWIAASETDLANYEVVRNGEVVERVNPEADKTYSYTDSRATNGTTYSYKVVGVGINGERVESNTMEATPMAGLAVITAYDLKQNYPNPFNPTTSITFDVKDENFVTLKVFNAMGQEVASLVNGLRSNGRYNVHFDSKDLTSGLYFYTIKIGNEFSATKKMLLVK
jgi:hypothetical protein